MLNKGTLIAEYDNCIVSTYGDINIETGKINAKFIEIPEVGELIELRFVCDSGEIFFVCESCHLYAIIFDKCTNPECKTNVKQESLFDNVALHN